MSKIVFILGAGASQQCGAPLMKDFIDVSESLIPSVMGSAFKRNFELVFKGLDSLQGIYSKSSVEVLNIESLFAAFEMAAVLGQLRGFGDKELEELVFSIKQVIVHTIEQSVQFGIDSLGKLSVPQPYSKFADLILHLKREHDVGLMTFNYDVALDFAFTSRNIPINYCLDKTPKEGLPIMKLHGSLNWIQCQSCNKIEARGLKDLFERGMSAKYGLRPGIAQLFVSLYAAQHGCAFCSNGGVEPAVVPPTWSKSQHYRNGIENVWKSAAKNLQHADNIFVIGYSLPETDHFFPYLYALGTMSETRLKRIWVYDPKTDSKERFIKLLGPNARDRFEFRIHSFDAAIPDIKRAFGG